MKTILKESIIPKLIVVGAGPGDPELITIKGVNALLQADVVLYDALVNVDLLKYVSPTTPKIYVGKREGNHSFSQDRINSMIVDLALKYGTVVRLKGGDPFIFGRGREEMEYAALFNIESEYVPGISSTVAVAGLQNIPLTYRGMSEGFWVVTGTTSNGSLSGDIQLAAKSSATIVILMGLKKLEEIVELFLREGKSATPVAVIQDGSLPSEKVATGTINNIVHCVKEQGIEAPAVIIIGDVVNLRKKKANESFNLLNTGWLEKVA